MNVKPLEKCARYGGTAEHHAEVFESSLRLNVGGSRAILQHPVGDPPTLTIVASLASRFSPRATGETFSFHQITCVVRGESYTTSI